MDETHKEILRRARKLIEKPGRWTQGEYAANAGGHKVGLTDQGACRFCAKGALYKVADEFDRDPLIGVALRKAEVSLSIAMGGFPVTHFNDTHKHFEVIAAFDAAIENTA